MSERCLEHVLKIGLLGAVQARCECREIPLGPPRQRAVLALLALEAGRTVPMERLIRGLWGERAPAGARGLVQGYVSRLRPALAGVGVTIAYAPQGYLLELASEQVDVHEFRISVTRARSLDTDEARAVALRHAIALWRGEPLSGVSGGELLDRLRETLAEERLSVIEECLNTETRAGRDTVLIPELIALVAEHPFREGLVGLLMLALCRAGRRADALERYERTRRRLVEELGLDPGPELRQLHQRILRGTVRAAGTVLSSPVETVTVPAQLPAEPGQFTGRAAELRLLDSVATRGDTVAISLVTGAGGVGKTALAVHWAHRIRSRFPDGQLYVNLRGGSPQRPLRPIEALGRFLRALGVPADRVPDTVEEAGAVYRSLLADRRVLVVLDNAGSVEQVRPLLPGGRRCATVVTSRERLAGLVVRDGAVPVPLGALASEEAVTLFGKLLGGERLSAEPEAARDLARSCGYLPLALRVAAADIAGGPAGDTAGRARRLADTRRSMPTLGALGAVGEAREAARGALDRSYRHLDPPSRRLFRLLGMLPGPVFALEAAAALAGTTPGETDRLLCGLAAARLVEETEPGRYVLHDLVREYALDRAWAEEPGPSRARALDALLTWYLHAVREADEEACHTDAIPIPMTAVT
ncbi:BTAD domain-containing putative transcriptional regulator [Streptosporangium saharense]|uniref:AfsR/SARP family transcriptional regulator n=1 Tax=Streptosporangium saharense TaxID=1706840 RepID=UPI0036A8D7AD